MDKQNNTYIAYTYLSIQTYRCSVTTYFSVASGNLLDFTTTLIDPRGTHHHADIGTKNGIPCCFP